MFRRDWLRKKKKERSGTLLREKGRERERERVNKIIKHNKQRGRDRDRDRERPWFCLLQRAG